jgi:hypothetical protein
MPLAVVLSATVVDATPILQDQSETVVCCLLSFKLCLCVCCPCVCCLLSVVRVSVVCTGTLDESQELEPTQTSSGSTGASYNNFPASHAGSSGSAAAAAGDSTRRGNGSEYTDI